jgi:hypothetical protein
MSGGSGGNSATAGNAGSGPLEPGGNGGSGKGGAGLAGSATAGSGPLEPGGNGGSGKGGAAVGGAAGTAAVAGNANSAGTPSAGAAAAGSGGTPSTGGSSGSAGAGSPPCSPTNGGFESCDGLDNDCNGTIDDNGCPATCQGVASAGSGYMRCDTMLTWDAAVAACAAENLLLMTVDSAAQNQVMMDVMYPADGSQDFSFAWIGLSRTDSASPFTWADGSPLGTYSNWSGGAPSNAGVANCTQVNNSGEWVNSRCDFLKRYICELP